MQLDLAAVRKQDLSSMLPRVQSYTWAEEGFTSATGSHYQLCAFLADQVEDSLLLDIGTGEGASALAFAANAVRRRNRVITVDKVDRRQFFFNDLPIDFLLAEATSAEVLWMAQQARLIFLDIDHTGKTERDFLQGLVARNFQGTLILNNIHLHGRFHALSRLWKKVSAPKMAIKETGIIDFSGTLKLDNPRPKLTDH